MDKINLDYNDFLTNKNLIISKTLNRLELAMPENFTLEVYREATIRDLNYNYENLAISLSYNNPELLSSYLSWVKTLFDSYNLNFNSLLKSYEIMIEVLGETFDSKDLERVKLYYDSALASLKSSEEGQITSNLPQLYDSFLNSILEMKKNEALEIVSQALKSGVDIKEVYLELFQKALYKIGYLWQTNKITVAHEHYATSLIQWIMAKLYQEYLVYKPEAPKIVVLCTEGELHELGARMVADFFEWHNWDSIFFGANTPSSSILKLIKDYSIKVVAISTTLYFNLPNLLKLIKSIKEINPNLKIIVGGRGVNSLEFAKQIGADGYAPNAQQAVLVVNSLLGEN